MTATAACKIPTIDVGKLDTACRVVEQARDGLIHVLLTGKGEPMLWPDMIEEYLDEIGHRFPIIELQTNGTMIEQAIDQLKMWKAGGLTRVCISIAHHNSMQSNQLMGITDTYSFWHAVHMLKEIGLSVRLNCTLLKNGIHTPANLDSLIARCKVSGVDQLSVREVDMPHDAEGEVADYVRENKPHGAAKMLSHWLMMSGATKLLELPHGGIVYDYKGQNVSISNCLTGTTDPNDIRQLIFFPDGRLMYDWRYEGARIL
jgi:molybdenum cofactor biosynthesis enzyme MoaA